MVLVALKLVCTKARFEAHSTLLSSGNCPLGSDPRIGRSCSPCEASKPGVITKKNHVTNISTKWDKRNVVNFWVMKRTLKEGKNLYVVQNWAWPQCECTILPTTYDLEDHYPESVHIGLFRQLSSDEIFGRHISPAKIHGFFSNFNK